ncbi:MAG: 30S ribosomal protein S19 [Candidatus Bathyarchaeota archaeon]|nr:MAG: 30S ribosomal protein S19 [Candidatus Bathyarchaeota archaeon]
MPKEFTYRGYTFEQLQSLSMDEFIRLLPSRHRRSLQRGLTIEQQSFLRSVRDAKAAMDKGQSVIVKTHARDMVVLPEMVGVTILLHSGKEFVAIEVTPQMVGHYLGEYSVTNKPVRHGQPGIGASRSSMYVPLK